MLNLQVEDVAVYISGLIKDTGIVTRQMRLDKLKSERPVAVKTPKKLIDKPAPIKKPNDIARENMAAEKRKKAEMKRLQHEQRRQVEASNRGKTPRRLTNAFKTKQVDYTQLRTIKIDSKTTIYCKPGQDPEAVKKRFLKNYAKVLRLQPILPA